MDSGKPSRGAQLKQILDRLTNDVKSYIASLESGPISGGTGIFELRESIRSNASNLVNVVEGPQQAVKNVARGYTASTALKVAVDLDLAGHVPEDNNSVTTIDLAERCGAEANTIRPMLKLLASHHIFREVATETWAHSPMSLPLRDKPAVAMMQTILDENYRANAHLPAYLVSTGYRAPSRGATAFNSVFSTPLDFYSYCNGQEPMRAARFATAMIEVSRSQLAFFDRAFDWTRVSQRSTFVDIAAGLGHTSYHIAARFPEARFVVQDHPTVLELAKQVCPKDMKPQVSFVSHDLFELQPAPTEVEDPKVFLLKIVLHDWDDHSVVRILGQIIPVLRPQDRILVIDTVIPTMGSSYSSRVSDVLTMSLFGAKHRTLQEFTVLINAVADGLSITTYLGEGEESDGMMVLEIELANARSG